MLESNSRDAVNYLDFHTEATPTAPLCIFLEWGHFLLFLVGSSDFLVWMHRGVFW